MLRESWIHLPKYSFNFDFIRCTNIWTFGCCSFYVIYLIFFMSISRPLVKDCVSRKNMYTKKMTPLCDNNRVFDSFLYSLLTLISFHLFLLRFLKKQTKKISRLAMTSSKLIQKPDIPCIIISF